MQATDMPDDRLGDDLKRLIDGQNRYPLVQIDGNKLLGDLEALLRKHERRKTPTPA